MSLLLPLYFRLQAPINQDLLQQEYKALQIKKSPWYLVSPAGIQTDDYALSATLQASPDLAHCPYVQTILADFDFAIGRVWFSDTLSEKDENLHSCEFQAWMYVRVLLAVDDKTDLVVEIERQDLELLQQRGLSLMQKHCLTLLGGGFSVLDAMAFDKHLLPIRLACNELNIDAEQKADLQLELENSFQAWRNALDEFGQNAEGELIYQQILLQLGQSLRRVRSKLPEAARCALHILSSSLEMSPPAPKRINRQLLRNRALKREHADSVITPPTFDRPVFIVSAPRAGSTLLFNSLSALPHLWTTGEENHKGLERIPGLHPQDHDYHSNCLNADDADEATKIALTQLFSQRLSQGTQNYADIPVAARPSSVRLLEKTPKNALRIPFLKSLFPDALFIYLYREPLGNIGSLVEGWRSRRFIAYQDIPNWRAKDWQFLLIPGWEQLNNKTLVEICVNQWSSANETIIQDLHCLDRQDWHFIDYQALIKNPVPTLKAASQFMDLSWNTALDDFDKNLPLTAVTLSQPNADKWRKYEQALQKFRGKTQTTARGIERLLMPV